MQIFASAELYHNPQKPQSLPPNQTRADIVAVPYIEIPIDLLIRWGADAGAEEPTERILAAERQALLQGPKIDPLLTQATVFEKEGRNFVRWFFHPEDKVYRNQITQHVRSELEGSCADVERTIAAGFWIGYKTASRSVIVQDPTTRYSFSVKTALAANSSHLGENDDRAPTRSEALRAVCMGSFLKTQTDSHVALPHADFWHDVLAFGIDLGDRQITQIVRQLPHEMVECDGERLTSYIPRFSLQWGTVRSIPFRMERRAEKRSGNLLGCRSCRGRRCSS